MRGLFLTIAALLLASLAVSVVPLDVTSAKKCDPQKGDKSAKECIPRKGEKFQEQFDLSGTIYTTPLNCPDAGDPFTFTAGIAHITIFENVIEDSSENHISCGSMSSTISGGKATDAEGNEYIVREVIKESYDSSYEVPVMEGSEFLQEVEAMSKIKFVGKGKLENIQHTIKFHVIIECSPLLTEEYCRSSYTSSVECIPSFEPTTEPTAQLTSVSPM
jgi:hypothetical protein